MVLITPKICVTARKQKLNSLGIFFISLVHCATCFGGRPLTVDDAGVENFQKGHVEFWVARLNNRSLAWTFSPAYSPVNDVEITAAFAYASANHQNQSVLQAKWRITPSQPDGCNLATSLSVARSIAATTPTLTGILTCTGAWGAANLNVGVVRATQASMLPTWGISYERPIATITAHIEYFGQRQQSPTLQMGARMPIAKDLQINGSIARNQGQTLWSMGTTYQF